MEPSPEVLAFAQPLAPAEVLAAPGPVAALLSAATAASFEEEAAAAEVALEVAVAAVAAPEVAAVVSFQAARAFAFAHAPARPGPVAWSPVQRVEPQTAGAEAYGAALLRFDHHGLLA